jgi:hypothetical protein
MTILTPLEGKKAVESNDLLIQTDLKGSKRSSNSSIELQMGDLPPLSPDNHWWV